MKPVNVLWRLPPYGSYKINVHALFSEIPLPNGKVSGIGVVIRNHIGKILRMVASTLHIQERRTNELYAMLEGLNMAYLDDRFIIELETDNHGALWDYRNAALHGVALKNMYVVQQLTQRMNDTNFEIDVRTISLEANSLATYLARHGAENWDGMVVVAGPFGRVFEIWSNDLGLGPIENQFMLVHEFELVAVVDDVEGEEAAEVLTGEDELMPAQEMI